MQKRTLLGIALLMVLTLGIAACGGAEPTPTPTRAPTATPTPTPPAGGDAATGEVVNINQTENPYHFVPDTYDFQVGKKYALTFESAGEFHTFTVDELDLNINIFAGESVVVEFTPSKVGTFKLYCIPHQPLGMVGEVRVQ